MKRLLALVLTTLMMLFCASPAMAKAEIRAARDEFPDVNMDGIMSIEDAKAILKNITGEYKNLSYDYDAGDLDEDGVLTSYDAHLMLVYLDENGFLRGKNGIGFHRGTRTNYTPQQDQRERFALVEHEGFGDMLSLGLINTHKSTNGLFSIQFDPNVSEGAGLSCSAMIKSHHVDMETGVVWFAYADIEPPESIGYIWYRDWLAEYGFYTPRKTTEYVCRIHENNKSFDMQYVQRFCVEGTDW